MSAIHRDEGAVPVGVAGPDLGSVQGENARLKDDFLRLAAEFDNYRKRTRRDSEQQAAAEKEAFICELLPVIDNLERAAACDRSVSLAQVHQGVQLTLLQLRALLRRHEIEATGEVAQPFDPHQHEALALRNNPNEPDQTILEVVERGYRRGPKLLRPAKVIVNDHDYLPGGPRGR
jgi:molecular chaperone GrpE